MDELSGEEPGYVPPDHKTTAEFRVPGRPADPRAAAGPGPEATIVDEPVDDLIDPGVTSQDAASEDSPPVTFTDMPVDDLVADADVEGPAEPANVTLQDVPADDLEDDAVDDPEDDPEDHASVTVSDIRVPPKVMAFEMPGQDAPQAEPVTVPEEEQAPPPAAGPQAARPVVGEAPWTEQFGAESESTNPGSETPAQGQAQAPAQAQGQAHAYAPPPPAEATVPPSYEATAPAVPPVASPSGGVPPVGPSGQPGQSRSGRPLLLLVLIGIVLLVAIAAVAVLLYNRGSETTGKAAPAPSSASAAPTSPGDPGGPPPGEAPATPPQTAGPSGGAPGQPTQAPAAPSAPIGPVLDGEGITYQLVQQSQGYFEGKMVITNRTGKPMRTWRLTFQVPGAVVKNIWGARLVSGGSSVEIRNLDGAPAIPPGGTWDVQFGASGPTSTPKGCELNTRPCGF
ncbi:hypothetical protein ETD83_01975 [Actinomadura soli]|uniref:CBM2 domain-containing protein n=1 Tax=Actinomadura soli TaxID=2508997 RepID=A0A5C4JKA9_9ACTN|nr:cellulose binding domain-containing protein [Actinomadura soli]TMR07055.1 hypothetical protein ETD83_01975 [Actinomadura soli]